MAAKLDQSLSDIIKASSDHSSSGPIRNSKKNARSNPTPYARPQSFNHNQPSGFRTLSSFTPSFTSARPPVSSGGSSSIFVGNLAPHVTWQALKDLMRSAGSVRRVEVQSSNKSYATVEFDDFQSARTAIAMFNNLNFEGQVLNVREDRENGRGASSTTSTESSQSFPRVIFANLPFDATWQELKDMCSPYGTVMRADVDKGYDSRSRGTGTVVFASQRSAQECIRRLNGRSVEGRVLAAYAPKMGSSNLPKMGSSNLSRDRVGAPTSSSSNQETRIMIAGLPFRAEWQELKDMCSPYGTVVRADIDKLPDGRSRGTGTVVFASQRDAYDCIRRLNGRSVEGRVLDVHAAGGSDAPVPGFKVYIGNLPWSCGWQELKDMGRPFGEVLFADLAQDPSGKSRGFGILTFAEAFAGRACISRLQGVLYEGRELVVHEDSRIS